MGLFASTDQPFIGSETRGLGFGTHLSLDQPVLLFSFISCIFISFLQFPSSDQLLSSSQAFFRRPEFNISAYLLSMVTSRDD